MAAPTDMEPWRILILLKDVRYIYGQYLKFFLPVPASSEKVAQTLLSLKDGIYRFDSRYNTGNEPLSVFCQLTLGLSDMLIAFRYKLRSCAWDPEFDTLDANDWRLELDTLSVDRFQSRLNPMLLGVDIINETMETALNESFGTRSETIEEIFKRIDEAANSPARLQELVHNFLHGNTVQTKLVTTDGRELHTFISANFTHRELGQKIAGRLKQETQDALNDTRIEEREGSLAWKIRHSIYWLSKSSEDLRQWREEDNNSLTLLNPHHNHAAIPVISDDNVWHGIVARCFLDALKAAWLLDDDDYLGDDDDLQRGASSEKKKPSFETQEVVACAKRKALGLLQSFYRDVFVIPDYDLIYEMGDFGICTDDERERLKLVELGDHPA